MNGLKRCIIFVALLFAGGIIAAPVAWGHSGVTLLDEDGNAAYQSGKPYSPKRTCGTTDCHISGFPFPAVFQLDHNLYESNATNATKDHGPGSPSYGNPYTVPYPLHGVTAGYHFQQGRNVAWGDTQRGYYNLPDFTSSPGMMGKY